MVLDKTFDDIDEADLRQLIENNVSEQKTIEYKEFLPEDNRESKKEFLADISSFANTIGGHIIFGVAEENGIPVEFPGIESEDFDSEILRLENLLRDGIQPRIQGISIKTISISGNKPVVIIRIPKSWSKPHVVNYQRHWRFYARNSAGKYQLDILELKSAFIASDVLGDKIRNFHFDRLSKLGSDETPIPLKANAKLIFHAIPFSSFESGTVVNFNSLDKDIYKYNPIDSAVTGFRYNLDGLVSYGGIENNIADAYIQTFRNGIIELVNASMFKPSNGENIIPSIVLEGELIKGWESCVSIHKTLSVSPPTVIIVSLTGVQGYKLAVKQRLNRWHDHTHLIDRETLLLPEIVVEDYSNSSAALLRPIFDAIWNSAGWPKSFGYDDSGEWGKGPNFRR